MEISESESPGRIEPRSAARLGTGDRINEEKQKRTFYNSWITDTEIRAESVKALADCGRARWKIKHEHTKVLKNRGYNLEHNFGHEEVHASENVCVMNLPAFLLHAVLYQGDEVYRR